MSGVGCQGGRVKGQRLEVTGHRSGVRGQRLEARGKGSGVRGREREASHLSFSETCQHALTSILEFGPLITYPLR